MVIGQAYAYGVSVRRDLVSLPASTCRPGVPRRPTPWPENEPQK